MLYFYTLKGLTASGLPQSAQQFRSFEAFFTAALVTGIQQNVGVNKAIVGHRANPATSSDHSTGKEAHQETLTPVVALVRSRWAVPV